MNIDRRTYLGLSTAALVSITFPRLVLGQTENHTYQTDAGPISVHPVSHASFVLQTSSGVVYVDPVGGAELYRAYPSPDLVLVTHEHADHYDAETLISISSEVTVIVTSVTVFERLPQTLASLSRPMPNGDAVKFGDIEIEAVPAYNIGETSRGIHPRGRGNGYILTIGARRIYIAGDTEDIPEMRALRDIFLAFVPVLPPYTMSEAQAASAVAAFKPAYVYPYHYRGRDLDLFESLLAAEVDSTMVVRGDWY